jgi:UPF0176 protein
MSNGYVNANKKGDFGKGGGGYTIVAMYCICELDHETLVSLKGKLEWLTKTYTTKGHLILGREGLNGTIACENDEIKIVELIQCLRKLEPFIAQDWEIKYSYHTDVPFYRMRILLKPSLLPLGKEVILDMNNRGTYVHGHEWNALIKDSDVTVVDVRNHYEISIGSFENAINPSMTTFKDFCRWEESLIDTKTGKKTKTKSESATMTATEINTGIGNKNLNRKIAMYCTGGIRCEIASAYLKHLGYNNVYHLKGGILGYLEEVSQNDSLFKGECYVFDKRVSVVRGVYVEDMKSDASKKITTVPGTYKQCHACRHPLQKYDLNNPLYEDGVSCGFCHGKRGKVRAGERHKQIKISMERGTEHLYQKMCVSDVDQVPLLLSPYCQED